MNILVVAGETSADQHGAHIVTALRSRHANAKVFGMGGPFLRQAGAQTLFDSSEISVVGITEVLPKIPRLLKVASQLVKAAIENKADVALLIDAPDFNLRLAKRLKRAGIRVLYFISPTVWAWREGRVKSIRQTVDEMLCILPFEPSFYAQRGVTARYVGHPLVEAIQNLPSKDNCRKAIGLETGDMAVALLPGSRHSEIRRLGSLFAATIERLRAQRPGLKFVVPIAPSLSRETLNDIFDKSEHVILTEVNSRSVLKACDVALVKSGTSTLECALVGTPFAVTYAVSGLTYFIAKRLVKVQHIALPNLLLQKHAVREFIQHEATAEALADEMIRLMNPKESAQQTQDFAKLNGLLESKKPADEVTAAIERVVQITSS